jgi:hypothetical protein
MRLREDVDWNQLRNMNECSTRNVEGRGGSDSDILPEIQLQNSQHGYSDVVRYLPFVCTSWSVQDVGT